MWFEWAEQMGTARTGRVLINREYGEETYNIQERAGLAGGCHILSPLPNFSSNIGLLRLVPAILLVLIQVVTLTRLRLDME